MADDTQDEMPFRWHDLPVEMQDMILDNLLGDEISQSSPDYEAGMSVKDYPLWNILAVSRDMKAQYEKRVAKLTKLIFNDHDNFNFTLLPMPARVSLLTRAEIRMFIVCENGCPLHIDDCQAEYDLSQTVTLIGKIQAQLPDLESLVLLFGLWCKSDQNFAWPNTPHHPRVSEAILKLEEIPKVESIAVYRAKERCLDASEIVDNEELLCSWSKASKHWEVARASKSNVVAHQTVVPTEDHPAGTEAIRDEKSAGVL